MDIFVEHLVTRKKNAKDFLISAGIAVGAAVVVIATLNLLGGQFGLLVAAAEAYFAYQFMMSRNIEYEYSVTNGEVDIDKIIAQKKRKRVLNIDCKQFEIVASVRDQEHQTEYQDPTISKTIETMSSYDAVNLYYAIFTHEGKKTRLIFEPTEKMLSVFKAYIPRKIFIQE